MTYTATESSIQDGEAVELFEFIAPNTTYRYTDAEEDITFDPGTGSQTWTAIPITRTELQVKQNAKGPEMGVELSIGAQLVTDFSFNVAPRSLELNIYRFHPNENFSAKMWYGRVEGWSVRESMCVLRVTDEIVRKLKAKIPACNYQQFCNNVLFDDICALTKATYLQACQITAFGSETVMSVSTVGGQADGYFNGGELTHDATGDSRMIVSHVGTTITILYPFGTDVDTLENMSMYPGCDHRLNGDCENKYDNVDNFNGMNFLIPQSIRSR